MTPQDLQRLASLIEPHFATMDLRPHERAELRRLLSMAGAPVSQPILTAEAWPYDGAPPSYGLAREEHHLAHLDIDPFDQIGPKGA